MSFIGQLFSQEESEDRREKITNDDNNKNQKNKKIRGSYSDNLRSRFGEAFLPYAHKLESKEIGKREKRKRKKKKQPKIRKKTVPRHIQKESSKLNEHNNKLRSKQVCFSNKRCQQNTTQKNEPLQWQGDTMTFAEEWPRTEGKNTIRIFNINLNGITYKNDMLEWEMTIAYLLDMQVDIFGLTEINLDLNNGTVRDKLIMKVKHFDKHIRLATSSSLQKVGNSPFKMGGQ